MLSLTLTATLQGLLTLTPHDTPSAPYFYTFTIQCTSCRETHAKPISFTRHEEHDLPNSRGQANFIWRCRMCKREASASIVASPTNSAGSAGSASSTGPGVFTAERSGPQEIVRIECRGLEVVGFVADGEWEATAESGTKFAGVELESGEWFEYDEKTGEEVSITEVKWGISKV